MRQKECVETKIPIYDHVIHHVWCGVHPAWPMRAECRPTQIRGRASALAADPLPIGTGETKGIRLLPEKVMDVKPQQAKTHRTKRCGRKEYSAWIPWALLRRMRTLLSKLSSGMAPFPPNGRASSGALSHDVKREGPPTFTVYAV